MAPVASRSRFLGSGLVATYVCICGLSSFCSGPVALVLSLIFLGLEILLAAEVIGLSQATHWLLLLWLTTASAAAVVGTRNYHVSFAPYLAAKAGRDYSDLDAMAQASVYLDAGRVAFTSDAVLDDSLSVGLRAKGHTYCAAPVLSRVAASATGALPTVQFWAVGLDCCGARQNFYCDSAGDVRAHGGVALPTPEDEGLDALSRAIFAPNLFHEGYMRAVRAASTLHELQTVDVPILLRWSARPEELLSGWLASALLVWIISSAVYCIAAALFWVAFQSMSGRPLWKAAPAKTALP